MKQKGIIRYIFSILKYKNFDKIVQVYPGKNIFAKSFLNF